MLAAAFHAVAFHLPTHPPKHKHDIGSEHEANSLHKICIVSVKFKIVGFRSELAPPEIEVKGLRIEF